MIRLCVGVAFAVVLFVSAVRAGSGGVTFGTENVTMTCPGSGTWFNKDKEVGSGETHEMVYTNGKRLRLRCVYDEKTYYFYVQGKVCDNCFQLKSIWFGLLILVDIFVTALVMAVIYRCTISRSHASKKSES